MKLVKRFLGILLSIALMLVLVSGMSLTAFADGGTTDTESVPAYTVEFTFDGKQYVMPGDSTVALKEILDCIGITGEVSDVKVSESTLFSGSNDSGEWVVTAHRAFSTDEWMRVIIDSRVYEIVVTDTKYTTSQTVTTDGNDWDWFGEGKYFVCDNSQTYTINGSITALAPSDGSGTDHGSNNWTATIDASGKLTHKIGGAQYTATLSGNNNTWHLYWNEYAPGYYGSGAAMWEQTYTAPPTVDPTVTAPTLAESRDYNGSPLQLITAETTSNSSGTRYYGLGTSSSSVPSTWYTSITDSNLKKTDQGTYFVWYKQDAATGYNAKAATYVGSVTINQKEVGLTWTNTNLTYNGQSQTPTATATGIISGDTCTVNITGGQTNYSASAYIATASSLSNDNYKLPDSGTTQTFTIGQREVTLSWPTNTTYPYNGKAQKPDATAGNLVSGDTCTVTVTGEQKDVGSGYTATATGLSNNNYKLPSTDTTCHFSISPAELTVTANDHTITYGDASANNGVGYSGFQNGETAAVLGGTLTYSYNYEQFDDAGNSYTITPGGLTSGNYNIQYVAGTLTVNPKSVTPSLTGAVSKDYDGGTATTDTTTNTLGITIDGVVNSDDVSATIGSAAYGSANVGTDISVTASNISLTGTKAGNYALSATTASANVGEITTRAITVKAADQSVELNKTVSSTADDVEITAGSLVNGHTIDSISVTGDTSAVTMNGTLTANSAVIKNAGTDVTANYAVTYTTGILTVTQGTPVVKEALGAASINYGQTLDDSAISGSMKDANSGADVSGTFTWDEPSTKPTVADSDTTPYAWTFTPNDTTNYASATGKLKLSVNPKAVELSWSNTELTYNGTAQKPTASVSNLETGDEGKVSVTVSGEQTNANAKGGTESYTAAASELTGDRAGNYTLTNGTNLTQTFTIAQKSISGATVELNLPDDLVFDGNSKAVSVKSVTLTVGDTQTTLAADSDYTPSGDLTGTDAGSYTVTVTGTGNYKDSAEATWAITIAPVTIATLPTAADITYGQTLSGSTISGSMKDNKTEAEVPGTFAWDAPSTMPAVSDSGATDYAWTFTPSNTTNYNSVTGTMKVTVEKKEVGLTWENTSFTYDGQPHAPTATATGLIGTDTCNVNVTGEQTDTNAKTGTTAYTATANSLTNDNYKLPGSGATQTFTIGQRPVTIKAKDQTAELNSSVSSTANDVEITSGSLVSGQSIASVTLSGDTSSVKDNGEVVFTAVVINDGASNNVTANYTPTLVNGTLKVTKIAPVYTAPTANTLTYNGQDQALVTVGSTTEGTIYYALLASADAVPGENTAWQTTSPTGRNAGNYYVWWKLTGDANHSDIAPAKLEPKINQKDLTVTANEQTITYGDAISQTAYTADQPVTGETLTVTLTANIDAGTITPQAEIKAGETITTSNYNLTLKNGTLTVNNASLTVTPDSGKTKVYGESDPALTYTATGFVNNENESVITGVLKREAGDNVGVYEISNDTLAAPHYTITVTSGVNFTITPKSIESAAVDLQKPDDLVYDGNPKNVSVTSVKLGETILVVDTDYEVTSGTTGTDKGTYTVTITGKGNYKDTATATWSIGLATPAIDTIPTASAITYGQTLADSTLTGGAAKLGENPVEGTFAWKNPETKPAYSDSESTEYDVVFTPTDSNNYATVECKVKLTVNKAEGGGEPSANTLVYKGSAQELVTAGEAEGGTMYYALGEDKTTAPDFYLDEAKPLIDTETWSTSVSKGTDAGTYYVWYMVKGDENHNDSEPQCVESTIAKKGLTVTADAKSKTQGEADPALTYTVTGLVGTDVMSGALSREAGEDPGTYAITQGTLTAGDNYEIAFTSAVLTINKKDEPAPAPSGGGGGYYGGGTVQNQRRDAYSDVIGAAATSFRDSSPERIHNIELACEKLDGIVLQPGEVFSFNEALGGLTAEDGFAVASVNPDDEATAEMGGGVSQVASTLYTGSLFALLETVERTNHPFAVPFIQPGTDAYVANADNGSGPDLKFRNTRGEPIRISAKTRVDEARQVREIVIELRSALGSSDYMPIRFDNTWGGDQNAFLTETPYDPTRPGYRILLTHEEQQFTDASGAGIRTLTHRKILDAAGMLVRDEILNQRLSGDSYAMDTYYQG